MDIYFTEEILKSRHEELWDKLSKIDSSNLDNSSFYAYRDPIIHKLRIFENILDKMEIPDPSALTPIDLFIKGRIKRANCFACGEAFRRNITLNKKAYEFSEIILEEGKFFDLFTLLCLSSCKYCPLNLGMVASYAENNELNKCLCEDVFANKTKGTLYTRWKKEGNLEKRKIIASKIRDPQWKKEKE